MSIKSTLLVASAFAFISSVSITQAQATNYELINLGTLGGIDSTASDINNSGHVTGSSWTEDGTRAFLYDGDSMHDLGKLPDGLDSVGTGINDSGQVTGYSKMQGATPSFFYYQSFLYNGSMQNLGRPAGVMGSFAYDLNDSGKITGRVTYSNPEDLFIDTSHVFLFDGSNVQDLGTLGGQHSSGYGINNNGHVTGWSDVTGDSKTMNPSNPVTHAFIYDGNNMQSIGTLGGKDSYGHDINDNDWVTGNSDTSSDDARHAFLYNGSDMQDIGTLGGENSFGHGINNNGQVVGNSQLASGDYAAFLYDGYSMLDLCMLTNCAAKGWDNLYSASGINDRGDITGYGKINGTNYAFLILADDQQPPPDPEICDDGIDNDGDNKVDCSDKKDCGKDPVCTGGGGNTEICDDGIDNDGDNRVDCADKKDCRTDIACQ